MTSTDRTGADTATFEAELQRLDRLEVADVAEDVREEEAARELATTLQDASLDEGVVLVGYEARTPMTAVGILARESALRLARAAIDALKPAPGTDSSGQITHVDVLRGGEHVATLGVVYGSVSVDTSGQVVPSADTEKLRHVRELVAEITAVQWSPDLHDVLARLRATLDAR